MFLCILNNYKNKQILCYQLQSHNFSSFVRCVLIFNQVFFKDYNFINFSTLHSFSRQTWSMVIYLDVEISSPAA